MQLWKQIINDDARFEVLTSPGAPAINATEVFNTYVLDNKVTEPTAQFATQMALQLVNSKDGVFRERHCNMSEYRELLHPEEGLGYVTQEETPVTLSYFYGCTDYYNHLGYLYFHKDAKIEDIMHAPRFILIDNARPDANVTLIGENGNESQLGGSGGEIALNGNVGLRGTKHKLVYFGEGTEFEKGTKGSYIFPKDMRIVLFIIKGLNLSLIHI